MIIYPICATVIAKGKDGDLVFMVGHCDPVFVAGHCDPTFEVIGGSDRS